MTIPVDSLLPTCVLYVDGSRFADGSTPGEVDTDPVALDDLRVVFGRSNSLDQPDPGTCTFQLLDVGGGVRFVDKIRIGSAVQVRAEATIFPDPNVPVFTFDAGFEGMTLGTTPPSTTSGCSFVVSSGGPPKTGTRSARIQANAYNTGAGSVIIPPAAFGGDWSAIPQTAQGQTWRYGASVLMANLLGATQTVRVRPVTFTEPEAGSARVLTSYVLTAGYGTTGWTDLLGEFEPPPNCWLGLQIEVVPAGAPPWDGVAAGLNWDAVNGSYAWDDLGRVFVDDLKLLAPAAGALRAATVFAGRVTDLRAQYDLGIGGTVIDVTCQTHLAELDNRYVGDTPWAAEGLASRFKKIVDASGQVIEYKIDSSVQNKQITWRDVDAQPAGDLLHQLAQSVGGALWSAATTSGQTYIWLEDINNRPAMATLVRGVDLVVRIVQNTELGTGDKAITLDACDVLLEPVEWVQTTEDDATRIVVTWQDQTLDGEGNPKPTSRDYLVDNPGAELLTGRRRVQVTTQLAQLADAQILADSLMARVGSPGWRVGGLTWDMANTDRLNAETLDQVMKILDGVTRLGLGILLTNMPDWAPPATGADTWLFLEGLVATNEGGVWKLELLTSSGRAQGKSTVRWDDIPGATVAVRSNWMYNPRAVSTGSAGWLSTRGFGGGAGTYSFVTTSKPAFPPPFPATVRRKQWSSAATNNNATGMQVQADTVNAIPCSLLAGKTVTVSCYMRQSSTTAKNFAMVVQTWTSLTGGLISTLTGATVAAPVDGVSWVRVSHTFTMPANAVGVTAFPDVLAGGTLWANGNYLDCTALLVEEGALGTYFDGAYPDTATQDFAWTAGVDTGPSSETPIGANAGWAWDQFSPDITWNDLHGVSI